jgi:Transcriptional regulatory protein, C terminal
MEEYAISFGPYRLLAAQRLLLERDKPVRLGSRAFDILAALVERAGEVVGKEQLIARAWPQTFVEESNLKIQVSALRRVAPVRREEPSQAALPPTVAPAAMHNLPFAVTRASRTMGRSRRAFSWRVCCGTRVFRIRQFGWPIRA